MSLDGSITFNIYRACSKSFKDKAFLSASQLRKKKNYQRLSSRSLQRLNGKRIRKLVEIKKSPREMKSSKLREKESNRLRVRTRSHKKAENRCQSRNKSNSSRTIIRKEKQRPQRSQLFQTCQSFHSR